MQEISTERLRLRSFLASDWQDLYDYLSDEEVVRFEPYPPFTVEEAKQTALERAENPDFIAVCLKSGKLIGNIYFSVGDYDTAEIGYVFNVSYQNQGYATEAARAVVNNAFQNLKVRRVVAFCNPLNQASWKLLERLKMRREGTLLQNIYFKKDEMGKPIWADTYSYAILKSEWQSKF